MKISRCRGVDIEGSMDRYSNVDIERDIQRGRYGGYIQTDMYRSRYTGYIQIHM